LSKKQTKKTPFPFDSLSLSVHHCCQLSFNATSSFDIWNLVAIVVTVVAATFVRFLSVNSNLATNSSSFQSISSTSNPENPSYSQKSSAIQRFTVASRGGSRSRGVGLKGDPRETKIVRIENNPEETPEQQQANAMYHAWKRNIKNPPGPNDIDTISAL
jgi:hypothetical protein